MRRGDGSGCFRSLSSVPQLRSRRRWLGQRSAGWSSFTSAGTTAPLPNRSARASTAALSLRRRATAASRAEAPPPAPGSGPAPPARAHASAAIGAAAEEIELLRGAGRLARLPLAAAATAPSANPLTEIPASRTGRAGLDPPELGARRLVDGPVVVGRASGSVTRRVTSVKSAYFTLSVTMRPRSPWARSRRPTRPACTQERPRERRLAA